MILHDIFKFIFRYRIVCFVTIIEKLQQSVDYKMNFAMDHLTDNYSSYIYEGATNYIISTVFLVRKD